MTPSASLFFFVTEALLAAVLASLYGDMRRDDRFGWQAVESLSLSQNVRYRLTYWLERMGPSAARTFLGWIKQVRFVHGVRSSEIKLLSLFRVFHSFDRFSDQF